MNSGPGWRYQSSSEQAACLHRLVLYLAEILIGSWKQYIGMAACCCVKLISGASNKHRCSSRLTWLWCCLFRTTPAASALSSARRQSCHLSHTVNLPGQKWGGFEVSGRFCYIHMCNALDSPSVKLGIIKCICLCKSLKIYKWKVLHVVSVRIS